VIRTLAYFQNSASLNSREPLAAFLSGARRHGLTTIADSLDADAAVIWSVLWAGRMRANQQIYQHYRSRNKPVIVIDVGALVRNVTWKIAVNHVTAQGHYGHTQDLDLDRPAKLGLCLGNTPTQSPAVLICAQHALSLQMQNYASVEDWIKLVLARGQQHTNRPFVIRPHPRSTLRRDLLPKNVDIQDPNKIRDTYDSFDLQFKYHAIVNHNSGPGIQAAIQGCRPVVDASSLAYPVCVDWTNIEQPYDLDRTQWLIELSHTEYTVAEMEQGTWFPRISKFLND
jgi:hypothetical protein